MSELKLINVRTKDGQRQFAEIPDRFGSRGWETLKGQLAAHSGVEVTGFVDVVSQAIIDFTYRAHHFTVDMQFGELWLFVADPDCPDELLIEVVRLVQEISQ